MVQEKDLGSYIAGLPIGQTDWAVEGDAFTGLNLDDLPEGVVTGSNMIQFEDTINVELRSAVALSLLAAQRVAFNDTAIATPDQWVERHNTVLSNLNWHMESGGAIDAEFKNLEVAVHKAIIPFLTAALGPAATAATLIKVALEQLHSMNEEKQPWIRLFERQSRRFDVSEFQFSYVELDGADILLRIAAARLDARFGRTQVLFFKVTNQTAKFEGTNSTLRGIVSILHDMNAPLKAKLASQAALYIQELEL